MRKLDPHEKECLSEALIAIFNNGKTQKGVENTTKIDQTTISRAKNKQIKTASPAFLKLCKYAKICIKTHIQPDQQGIPQEVEAAYAAYLARGGNAHSIVDMIKVLTSVANSDDH